MLIVIIALVFFCLLMLLITPIRVNARVHMAGLNAWGSVSVELLGGLLRPRVAAAFLFGVPQPLRISFPKVFTPNRSKKKRVTRPNKTHNSVPPRLIMAMARNFLGALQLETLELLTSLGVADDAAITALLSGALSSFFSPIFFVLHERFPCARLLLNATPCYNTARFDISAHCIIRADLAHIIGASIKALLHHYKGALRSWHIPSRA